MNKSKTPIHIRMPVKNNVDKPMIMANVPRTEKRSFQILKVGQLPRIMNKNMNRGLYFLLHLVTVFESTSLKGSYCILFAHEFGVACGFVCVGCAG